MEVREEVIDGRPMLFFTRANKEECSARTKNIRNFNYEAYRLELEGEEVFRGLTQSSPLVQLSLHMYKCEFDLPEDELHQKIRAACLDHSGAFHKYLFKDRVKYYRIAQTKTKQEALDAIAT